LKGLSFLQQDGVSGQEAGDGGIDRLHASLQIALKGLTMTSGQGAGAMFEVIDNLVLQAAELIAQEHQFGQFPLLRRPSRGGGRLHPGSEISQTESIHGIGFGQTVLGFGKVMGTAGIDDGEGDTRLVQDRNERLLVTTAGFEDDVDRDFAFGQPAQDLTMTGRAIGHGEVGRTGTSDFQSGLGHIDTDIDTGNGHE
jgi:hypothetical protein